MALYLQKSTGSESSAHVLSLSHGIHPSPWQDVCRPISGISDRILTCIFDSLSQHLARQAAAATGYRAYCARILCEPRQGPLFRDMINSFW